MTEPETGPETELWDQALRQLEEHGGARGPDTFPSMPSIYALRTERSAELSHTSADGTAAATFQR